MKRNFLEKVFALTLSLFVIFSSFSIQQNVFAGPNGNGFDIDGAGVLISYLGTESVVYVPEGVIKIGYRAFYNNETITKIYLPET